MSDNSFGPIFSFTRDRAVEVMVSGCFSVYQGKEELFSYHGDTLISSRSTLKPWQALSLVPLESKAHWAMTLASHSGQDVHIGNLQMLQAELNVQDNEVLLPRTLPLKDATNPIKGESKKTKAKIFHPCYGKHLLYAAMAKETSSDLSYVNPEHPLNLQLEKRIKKIVPGVRFVPDSCGLPNLVCSLNEYLELWACFPDQEGSNEIRNLWGGNPILVGGTGRLDTGIMQATGGRVLAKEGADGMLLVQTNDSTLPYPYTIVVKVGHGYNPAFLGLTLLEVLLRMDQLQGCLKMCLDFLKVKESSWKPTDQKYKLLIKS